MQNVSMCLCSNFNIAVRKQGVLTTFCQCLLHMNEATELLQGLSVIRKNTGLPLFSVLRNDGGCHHLIIFHAFNEVLRSIWKLRKMSGDVKKRGNHILKSRGLSKPL